MGTRRNVGDAHDWRVDQYWVGDKLRKVGEARRRVQLENQFGKLRIFGLENVGWETRPE